MLLSTIWEQDEVLRSIYKTSWVEAGFEGLFDLERKNVVDPNLNYWIIT